MVLSTGPRACIRCRPSTHCDSPATSGPRRECVVENSRHAGFACPAHAAGSSLSSGLAGTQPRAARSSVQHRRRGRSASWTCELPCCRLVLYFAPSTPNISTCFMSQDRSSTRQLAQGEGQGDIAEGYFIVVRKQPLLWEKMGCVVCVYWGKGEHI